MNPRQQSHIDDTYMQYTARSSGWSLAVTMVLEILLFACCHVIMSWIAFHMHTIMTALL